MVTLSPGDTSSMEDLHMMSPQATAILVNVLIEGKPCLWVYGDDTGEMKDFQATLELKQGTVPKFFHPRPVSFALKNVVDTELSSIIGQHLSSLSQKRW